MRATAATMWPVSRLLNNGLLRLLMRMTGQCIPGRRQKKQRVTRADRDDYGLNTYSGAVVFSPL